MLESPFFLDKTIEDGWLTTSSSEAIEIYMLEHSELSRDLLGSAARGAFAAHRAERGGRTFPLEIFEGSVGPDVTQPRERWHIGRSWQDAYFQHDLFHDFLAARYLAVHREEWGQSTFDAISFGASSFDAVSKVLERLGPETADDFVRKIYGWNPYTAAYAIGDVEVPGSVRVSSELKLVIAAMLAERR